MPLHYPAPAVQTGVDGLACQKRAVVRTGRRLEVEAQHGLQSGSGKRQKRTISVNCLEFAWDKGLTEKLTGMGMKEGSPTATHAVFPRGQ